MSKKVVFGEDGIQVEEIGGPSATVLEVTYDEPNDRVAMQPKSMAGNPFITMAETALGERVSVDSLQVGPLNRGLRNVTVGGVSPALDTDIHVTLNGNLAPQDLDLDPIAVPGRKIAVTAVDISNPCSLLSTTPFVKAGLPPATPYLFTAPFESLTLQFNGTAWIVTAAPAIPVTPPTGVYPMDHFIWVDGDYTGGSSDGSIGAPYTTIQAALNTIADPVDADDMKRRFQILVKTGIYDEDLDIPPARYISLVALGPVTLSDGAGQYFDTPTTPRNINYHLDQSKETAAGTPIIPTLMLTSLIENETTSTHTSYTGGWDISGNILTVDDNPVGGTTHELHLYSTKVRGDILGAAGHGTYNMYFKRCLFDGAFDASQANIIYALSCEWDGVPIIDTLGRMVECEMEGATFNGFTSYLPPTGFFNCDLDGTYTTIGNIPMDGVSNYWFKTNGAAVAGGGAKLITDDLIP